MYIDILIEQVAEGKVPENFYLTFCMAKALKTGLLEKRLPGIKGVMGVHNEGIYRVLCRDKSERAILEMPGKALAAINDLDQILYTAEDMLSHNMRKAKRVDLEHWLRHIPEYFERALASAGIDGSISASVVDRLERTIAWMDCGVLYHYKINSTDDFSDVLLGEYDSLIEDMVFDDEIEADEEADDMVHALMPQVARMQPPFDEYEEEEKEWLVNGETLNIPDGSTLTLSLEAARKYESKLPLLREVFEIKEGGF